MSEIWPADEAVDPTLPLAGVRVLDLSRVLAGPFAAQVLGDLGADVVKVEQPEVGDPVRQLGPPFVRDSAAYFLATNRNRRSITADFADPVDRARVTALAREAHVVLENFLPHQAEAFGLDDLRTELEAVVWVSIRPARSGGPLAAQPAFDLLAQAASGIMAVTGALDGEPTKVGAPIADVVAGLYAAVAALAGLTAKGRTGVGLDAEVPLLESAMSLLVNQTQNVLVTGVEPRRLGNDHPSIAPYGPVTCADGLLLLAVGTERQYRALLALLHDPALADDLRFADNGARVANRAALRAVLDGHFGQATTATWLDRLTAAQIPASPINTVTAALDQPQVTTTDLLLDATYDGEPVRLVGSPITVDGRVLPLRRQPPRLGAHDDLVPRGDRP